MSTKHTEDLQHIRSMMERSSRFISLSGLSGIFAGIFALIASAIAYSIIYGSGIGVEEGAISRDVQLLLLFLITLGLALSGAIFFTMRKSKKQNLTIFNKTTYRILLNLGVPLLVGAILCLAFYNNHSYQYIAPTTLVFYGLGLFSASNFTFGDIRYLGYSEIILGIIGYFTWYNGLLLWTLGFGVLHIIYGIVLYTKYR